MKDITEPWDKVPTKPVGANNKGELVVCPEGIDYNTVRTNLEAKIQNIRNAKGLSSDDNKRLQILNQIFPTFKFLN